MFLLLTDLFLQTKRQRDKERKRDRGGERKPERVR